MAQLPGLFSTLTTVIKDIVENNPNNVTTNAQQPITMMLTMMMTMQSSSLMMHLPPTTLIPSTKDENLPQPLLTQYIRVCNYVRMVFFVM